MKILKSTIPEASLLQQEEILYDYINSFKGSFIDRENGITPNMVCKAFFATAPKWINQLFNFRNILSSFSGIKSSPNANTKKSLFESFKVEMGHRLGLFKVYAITKNEVVLGEDDKHLNFRIYFHIRKQTTDGKIKELTVSTAVKFNNWFGRLYFLPVKPFHKFIVPSMLKAMILELETKQLSPKAELVY